MKVVNRVFFVGVGDNRRLNNINLLHELFSIKYQLLRVLIEIKWILASSLLFVLLDFINNCFEQVWVF